MSTAAARGLSLEDELRKLGADLTSGELVYSPTGTNSFFDDLRTRSAAAEERLTRHREQIANVRRERQLRALNNPEFEFRIEPNTTPGQGGYFDPPAWLIQLFSTANRPGRVLAGLMNRVPLPDGVSSVSLPVVTTGTTVQPSSNGPSPGTDLTDAAVTSRVLPFFGDAEVTQALIDLSPPGASFDWAVFMDMSEALDADLEAQVLYGAGPGGAPPQLLGVMSAAGINNVTYNAATPTGAGMWPVLSQAMAQVGNTRKRPPECWLMRTSRWAWIQGSEDLQNLPFGISTRFFIGNTNGTPDPIAGLQGLPVFLDDAIPANLSGVPGAFTPGVAGVQDAILALRPSDMILLESAPRVEIFREPLSATAGVRLRLHSYAASITNRRAAGIAVVSGTGFAVQAGF